MDASHTAAERDAAPTVGSLGERETLARILPHLPTGQNTLLGPGDDAAVVRAPDGRFAVTTDLMVQGPDFRLAWSTARDLGWKAAASNLADVGAMGAVPTALVVALAVPGDTPVGFLEEFAAALRDACAVMAPGCGVVGGDLSVSPTLTIAITAFGDLRGRAPVRRDGARPGDVVAVSGVLGRSGRGLAQLFAEGVDADGRPGAARARILRDASAAVRWHLAPTPPVADGVLAAEAGATSMLDLSDGLALDAGRVATASGVDIELFEAELGGGHDADEQLTAREALAGGEDHTLFATFPAGVVLPGGFRTIGRVVAASDPAHPTVTVDGRPLDEATGTGATGDSATGWDPYALWDGAVG